MTVASVRIPDSWLAFELNILRRLKFESIGIIGADRPDLGAYLKHWGTRVYTNNITLANHTMAVASINNNTTIFEENDIEEVLEDVYVPQFRFRNPLLERWFGETDAWWFDNVSANIERLDSPIKQAVASSLVMSVGDYALSFDEKTRRLRQPFSKVFRKFAGILAPPVDNTTDNTCSNRSTKEFVAESYPDLLFLRLPRPRSVSLKQHLGDNAWKEEWLTGDERVWEKTEAKLTGNLGAVVETKGQYMSLMDDLLKTASHIPKWAIVHTESQFISTQDIVESISKIRRVETIYTKDFTELIGTKAVVISA